MERLFLFIERRNKAVLLVILMITVAMATQVTRLSLDTDYTGMLPPDPAQAAIKESVLGSREEFPNDLYLMIEGPDIFAPASLDAMERVAAEISGFEQIGPALSPFSFVTLEKKGSRLATVPLSPHKDGSPWTDEESALFRRRLLADDMVRGMLCSPSADSLLIYFPVRNLDPDVQEPFDRRISEIAHSLDPYGTVSLVGNQLFEDRLSYYLSHDLTLLLSISLLVILVLYYVSFRAKRAVLIPFSLSIIGMVWTLGTMALLGYRLTIVTIITPCMVLILGSSYSIHVISEYFRSFSGNVEGKETKQKLARSLQRINKTILTASMTTIVGFLSLLWCDIEAFRDLGIIVSLGILYCAILSLTYIPAWLSLSPLPKRRQLQVFKHGLLSNTVASSSRLVIRYWGIFVVILMVIAAGFFVAKDRISVETDFMSYYPSDDSLISTSIHFARKMGGSDPHYITLTAPDGQSGYFFRPEVLQKVYAFETAIGKEDPDINHILSFSQYVAFANKTYGNEGIPDSPGLILMISRMLNLIKRQAGNSDIDAIIDDDGTMMSIIVRYYDSARNSWQSIDSVRNLQQAIRNHRSSLPDDVSLIDWGAGVDGTYLTDTILSDQTRSMLISFLLVFLIVCIQFRSVLYGFFAIIPILTGVMGNYVIMAALDIPFDVVTSIFASVTVGTGVDDAIHFLVRYRNRKNLHPSQPLGVVLNHTLRETGRPIVLTSSSIILGMLVLTFSSFAPIRYFGLLLAIALLTTTVSTLFVLPSVMIAFHIAKQLATGGRSPLPD